jgi:hypothetical protein
MTTLLAIGIWRKRAQCLGQEALFQQNPKKAKKEICSNCPVIEQCLKYALIYDEHGIWGGTTKESRELIIRDQPEIRTMLIQEARALGIYEVRKSADDYYQAMRKTQARYSKEKVFDPVASQWDWNDPDTWLVQAEL